MDRNLVVSSVAVLHVLTPDLEVLFLNGSLKSNSPLQVDAVF